VRAIVSRQTVAISTVSPSSLPFAEVIESSIAALQEKKGIKIETGTNWCWPRREKFPPAEIDPRVLQRGQR